MRIIAKNGAGKVCADVDFAGSPDEALDLMRKALVVNTRIAKAPHTRLADTEPALPAEE